MNLKQKLFWGTIVVLYLSLTIYALYPLFLETEYRCGKVISKHTPTVMDIHKYSANIRVENRIIVQLDKDVYQSQRVDDATYIKYSVGSRICFPVDDYNKSPRFLLGLILSTILAVVFLGLFISAIVEFYLVLK